MSKAFLSLLSIASSAMSLGTKPVVKLHSTHSAEAKQRNLRVIHFIRHAEGYHNINKDYKNPLHIDAELTPKGINQSENLSKRLLSEGLQVDCIVSSPMRRAIQTSLLSFRHMLDHDSSIPVIASEHWRETVNYLCDVRLNKSELEQIFNNLKIIVDFSAVEHEVDPIWNKYETKYGPHDVYTKHRESLDNIHLEYRARNAWKIIVERPEEEKSIAVVSHSAFFMHIFTRLGVVAYQDEEVEQLMTRTNFENCEMRSVAMEFIA